MKRSLLSTLFSAIGAFIFCLTTANLTKADTVAFTGSFTGVAAQPAAGRYAGPALTVSITNVPGIVAPFGAATRNQPPRKTEGVVGTWYYISLINDDGSEKELSNRESFLDLKADGTFENSLGVLAGRGSQIGTYSVSGNRLTLNAENREPKTYTMTFGNDGKKTHGLSGQTLKLINKDGIGYKLERKAAE
jgi:hypothetical protein